VVDRYALVDRQSTNQSPIRNRIINPQYNHQSAIQSSIRNTIVNPQSMQSSVCSRQSTISCATLLALSIALPASAQTLVVRGAPPNSTVEFVLNGTNAGSTTVNADGDAVIESPAAAKKPDIEAYIYVDECEAVRRVFVVDRGMQPAAPGDGCNRTQISALFDVKPVSTIVVTVSGVQPTVLLRQGRFDLHKAPGREWGPSPFGLVLFGGGALTSLSQASALSCGDVADCAGDDTGFGYTAGIDFWFAPFLAAEVSYTRPAESTAEGGGSNFRFDSGLDVHALNIAGKVGIPIKIVRLYGQGGATYHRARWDTEQTIDPRTVTTDTGTITVPGGTQTYSLETAGWGWSMGGGLEIWLARSFALYAEGGRFALKGPARDGGEGTLDQGMGYVAIGGRVRLWR
jgi:hypothetical protein